MDGRLIAPLPEPGEDHKFFHRHMGDVIELEAGETEVIDWLGVTKLRTLFRCPTCGQEIEQLQ